MQLRDDVCVHWTGLGASKFSGILAKLRGAHLGGDPLEAVGDGPPGKDVLPTTYPQNGPGLGGVWESLSKQSVNAVIGTFTLTDRVYTYRCVTSRCPDDALPHNLKRVVQFSQGRCTIVDYICRTELSTTTTLRPLHDMCMASEHLRVGQAL